MNVIQSGLEYVKTKGIVMNVDGCYQGELDDFMEALDVIESITLRLETERREKKRQFEKYCESLSDEECKISHAPAFGISSIFDLGNMYEDCVNAPNNCSLLDKQIDIIQDGYMFLLCVFKACEDIIEYQGISLKGKHI